MKAVPSLLERTRALLVLSIMVWSSGMTAWYAVTSPVYQCIFSYEDTYIPVYDAYIAVVLSIMVRAAPAYLRLVRRHFACRGLVHSLAEV